MKFLIPILCVFVGFAAANLFEAAGPLVDDAVSAFMEGMGESGSLRRALGMPDAVELDRVEGDLKEEIANKLKEALDKLLIDIEDKISHGKEVAKDMLEKVKKYKEQLKDLGKDLGDKAKELLEKIKEKAKDYLKKLLEKFGLGYKRNLHQEYDVVARSDFKEIVERIKSKILSDENIQKIREYIKNFVTNNPVIKAFKKILLELKDVDLREIIRSMFENRRDARSIKDAWEKIKEFFKDLNEKLQEKTKALRDWFKEKLDSGFEKLKDKYGMIKALALEVIDHAKDIHGEVAREAMEFFEPYKKDLGALWKQLVEALKEHMGSF